MAAPSSGAREEGSSGARKQVEHKKCGVCGDRALGYNFNAVTCESCKAFFRRNALRNKEFMCPFKNECQVDQVTRRFCQKCRLRKCFEIGMKKEWILTEEEKKIKKQKIELNRARKVGEAGQNDEDTDGEGSQHKYNNNNINHNNNISIVSNSNNCSSSSSSPAEGHVSLPSSSSSSSTKPHAVIVGIIRENDLLLPKVTKLDTHHHHIPKDAVFSNYEVEYSSSSPGVDSSTNFSEEAGILPQAATDDLPASLEVDEDASNTCLAEVFANSIKKEVEYMDDQATAILNQNHNYLSQPSSPPQYSYEYTDLQPPPPPQSTTPLYPSVLQHTHFIPVHTPPPSLVSLEPQLQMQAPLEYKNTDEGPGIESSVDGVGSSSSSSSSSSGGGGGGCGFSVKEAMQILHPEDKHSGDSSFVMDTLMNTAIQAEYSSPLLSLHLSPPNELNEAERAKLEELTEANKGLLAPLCEDYNFKDLSNPSLINVINLTEIAIRRLIKMAKRISSFKTLCQEDQIALLKGGCTEMMILRSVCAYDPDKDSWKIQQDHSRTQDIKLKVLKAAPGNVYEEHKRFILAFEPEWRRDPHIIFLLCAITLFNPRRPHIIHADAILHEQCSYLYLTRRYLAARYNPCAGRDVYHQLLHRLAHLHRLSEEHVRLFLEVNPKQVEPLLIEIFDLKQR